MGGEANQCARAGRPAILQGLAISAADIHCEQGAGKGIEPRGVNKAIEIVVLVSGVYSRLCNRLDWGSLDIDECRVIAAKPSSWMTGTMALGFNARYTGELVGLKPAPQSSRSKGKLISAQAHKTFRTLIEVALPRIRTMSSSLF
jgi:hypothetical protein